MGCGDARAWARRGQGSKIEMGSAVNIGVNRGAIGMNRSGMTLLPDLNLSRYRIFSFFSFSFSFFFFLNFIIQRGESNLAAPFRLFVPVVRSFISITSPSSRRRTWKSWFRVEKTGGARGNFPLAAPLISSGACWFKFVRCLFLSPPLLPPLSLSLSVSFSYVSYIPCDLHEFSSRQRVL